MYNTFYRTPSHCGTAGNDAPVEKSGSLLPQLDPSVACRFAQRMIWTVLITEVQKRLKETIAGESYEYLRQNQISLIHQAL